MHRYTLFYTIILTALMTLFMSVFITLMNTGITSGILWRCLQVFISSFPVALFAMWVFSPVAGFITGIFLGKDADKSSVPVTHRSSDSSVKYQ